MRKERIKIYPNSIVYRPTIDLLSTGSVERISKYLTSAISILLASSVLIGFISGLFLTYNFGIDFQKIATLEDYIRLTITNLPHVIIVSGPLIYANMVYQRMRAARYYYYINKHKYRRRFFRACVQTALYVLFIASVIAIYLPTSLRLDILSFVGVDSAYEPGSDAEELKEGNLGLNSVKYGKDLNELNCLAFIAEVGNRHYYWSISTDSLVSIDKAQIIVSSSQLETLMKYFKEEGVSMAFDLSEQNISRLESALDSWHKLKMEMCPAQ